MEYLKELMVLGYSLMVFAALMYLWHNYLSPWREPNKELLRNANEWQKNLIRKRELKEGVEFPHGVTREDWHKHKGKTMTHEELKVFLMKDEESQQAMIDAMRDRIQQDFKQMVEEEENHFWNNPPGNYENHE